MLLKQMMSVGETNDRGAKPSDLPVEQRTKFKLVVSLKTAKALGLTFAHSPFGRADEVFG
jgi:putative tryptophan/tyrosine transport system substrate-binding protein